MHREICPYCKSTIKSIKESGFVGCEHCYSQIDALASIARELFEGQSFNGRPPKRREDGKI